MSNQKGHLVASKWREIDALAFEERASAIGDWLDHTEDLVAMFKDDEKIATELRSLAGVLRTKRSDFTSETARLRAELGDAKQE